MNNGWRNKVARAINLRIRWFLRTMNGDRGYMQPRSSCTSVAVPSFFQRAEQNNASQYRLVRNP
jgi:hypothetical protein